MNTWKQQPRVLIVGAGPTGMTAALELSRMGIPLRIIEKEAQPATTSRAIGVQARTLELFAQRGLVETMLAKGNRGVGASVYGSGKRTFRLEFEHNGSEYGYILFLSQAETEANLRGALERQQIKIEREVELIALSQSEHDAPVTAIVKHGDGSLEEIRAEYVIDSEGSHSVSRATMGLRFTGKTREEDYVLGDLFVDGDLPDTDLHVFSSEHGFMGMFPMGGKHYRLIASHPLSKPSKDTAPSLEEIQKIYDQRSHIPAHFHDMIWSSWFRINSRMVDHLRVGRVFFGGDSAHIHSPAGAQGMNTGIQDMVNLCWKLTLVIEGKADAKLLDTYNDDRFPVIKGVLSQTEELTDALGSENQIFRSVFRHFAPWIVGTETVQENSTERMCQLSLNYRDSPLSVTHHASGSLRAGDRVPNLQVEWVGGHGMAHSEPKTVKLFELFSPDRFTLLFTNLENPDATHNAVQEKLAAWHWMFETSSVAPVAQSGDRFKSTFGSGSKLTFVRPDGYAAFVGTETSLDDLAKYLETWFPKDGAAKQATHA